MEYSEEENSLVTNLLNNNNNDNNNNLNKAFDYINEISTKTSPPSIEISSSDPSLALFLFVFSSFSYSSFS